MLVDWAWSRRRALHAIWFLCTLGAFCVCLKDAKAQDAKALFDEGWVLLEAGKTDAACDKFDQSFKASGATAALQSLAECEGRRGRHAASYKYWTQTLARLAGNSPDRARAATKQAESAAKVTLLTVHLVPDTPPGAKVSVGKVEFRPGEKTAIDAGNYTVVAIAPGRGTAQKQVELRAGTERDIEMTLTAVVGSSVDSAPPLPPSSPEPIAEVDEPHTLRTVGLIVGAVGVVGIGVGIGTWIPMLTANSSVSEACDPAPDSPTCAQKKVEAQQTVDDLAVPNAIALVAGIVSLGVGATLVIVDAATSGSSSQAAMRLELGPARVGIVGSF